jgi:hypothetical protein
LAPVGDKDLDKIEKELANLSREERQLDFQKRAFGGVVGTLFLVGIWALTGAGYFWPGWVMLFIGIDIARRAYMTFVHPPAEPDELE